jgi:hypothetical protein
MELSGGHSNDSLDWWSRKVGYTKVADRWGIALKKVEGNHNYPEEESVEIWLFNEAPRWMRIEAVGGIPDVLDALLKEAEDTTKKIKDKTAQAYELAVAMNKVAEEAQPTEGESHAQPAQ